MKALHPSDASHGCAGIPTRDARPSVPLNFMVTQNISTPNSGDAWNADVYLNPTPLYFGKVRTYSPTGGGNHGTHTISNAQLGISGFGEFGAFARTWNQAAMVAWCTNVSKWRLTYASVTATLSASSTSNQGTVTCAQYPYMYRRTPGFPLVDLGAGTTGSTHEILTVPVGVIAPSVLQPLLGSTTWEAKEGAYAILRLSEDALGWKTLTDVICPQAIIGSTSIGQVGTYPSSAVTDFASQTTSSINDVPFGPQGVWGKTVVTGSGATFATASTGADTIAPNQDYFAHCSFSGLDADATIQLTYRIGFEAVVPPSSIYLGQMVPALTPDAMAIDAYFNAARFLQSAYPASYNIWGTLSALATKAFPVIKDIGASLLPAIKRGASAFFGLGSNVPLVQNTTPSNNVTDQSSLRTGGNTHLDKGSARQIASLDRLLSDMTRINNSSKKKQKRGQQSRRGKRRSG